jgi:hypothetical protein
VNTLGGYVLEDKDLCLVLHALLKYD